MFYSNKLVLLIIGASLLFGLNNGSTNQGGRKLFASAGGPQTYTTRFPVKRSPDGNAIILDLSDAGLPGDKVDKHIVLCRKRGGYTEDEFSWMTALRAVSVVTADFQIQDIPTHQQSKLIKGGLLEWIEVVQRRIPKTMFGANWETRHPYVQIGDTCAHGIDESKTYSVKPTISLYSEKSFPGAKKVLSIDLSGSNLGGDFPHKHMTIAFEERQGYFEEDQSQAETMKNAWMQWNNKGENDDVSFTIVRWVTGGKAWLIKGELEQLCVHLREELGKVINAQRIPNVPPQRPPHVQLLK